MATGKIKPLIESLHINRDISLLFVEQAPVAIAMLDLNMHYLAVSQRWKDDYSISDRDVIGLSHYEVFPEVSDEWRRIHKLGLAGETSTKDEDLFIRADGSSQWLRWEVLPWFTTDESVDGIIISTEDITRYKQSEEVVRKLNADLETQVKERTAELSIANKELRFQNEEKALLLMNSTHQDFMMVATDGVHILDMQGNLLQCSYSFAALLGYTRAEMVGLNVLAWAIDFTQSQIAGFFAAPPSSREMIETKNRRKDGVLIDVQIHANIVVIDGKQCVFASTRDITQQKQARAQLDLLSACLANTKDVVMITEAEPLDLPGPRIVYVNDAFEKLTGYSREEAIGNTPRMLQGPKSDPIARRQISEALKNWKSVRAEVVNYAKDGHEFWVELDISPLADAAGWYTHWISVQRDITERKATEVLLGRYKAIIDSTEDAVLSKDFEGIITSWNAAAEKLYGYSEQEMIGRSIFILVPNETQENLIELMKRVEQGESVSHYRASRMHKDGHQISVSLSLSSINNLHGEVIGISSVANDISNEVRLEGLVYEMAFYDPLTKLANRRLLEDRITQAITSSNRTGIHGALLYLDLDNFKSLNDTHGHEAGDALLIEVARRLKSCVRGVDTVSRIGGDEFVILIAQLEEDELVATQHAHSIAEKIRLSLEEPYILKMQSQLAEFTVSHHCTASIGVALFFGAKKSLAELMKDADAKMYEAKHAGRNTVRFYQSKE